MTETFNKRVEGINEKGQASNSPQQGRLGIDAHTRIKAYEGKGTYAFVSYSHKDSPTVYPVIAQLARKGCRIWYDEGIPLVSDYGSVLYNRIMNCTVFIVFKSYASVRSEDVEKELLHAISFKKPIIQIAINWDAKYPPAVAYHIPSSRQYLDIHTCPAEFYEKLEAQLIQCKSAQAVPVETLTIEEAPPTEEYPIEEAPPTVENPLAGFKIQEKKGK